MKQPFVRTVLAIPLALSACLTEPDPEAGPEPPGEEDATPSVPERPIARPAAPPLVVEREYRVQAQPPDFPAGGGLFAPPWDPILKHNDALAIAGDGDVHVIGSDTWYHLPAAGGPAVATVVRPPGGIEEPFAVAMGAANDLDPSIAILRGTNLPPAMERRDAVTHNVEALCHHNNVISNSEGHWRVTRDASGFWITGKVIMLCGLDGTPLGAIPRNLADGRMRHPHNSKDLPGYPTRSLEVNEYDTRQGYAPIGSTALRLGAGTTFGSNTLMFETGVTTQGLWAAVDPGGATGYALVRDRAGTESGYAIVPVNMLDGSHGTRRAGGRFPGEIVGGMLLIEPLSHDLYAFTSHRDPAGVVTTTVSQFHTNNGQLSMYRGNEMLGTIHDAVFVGENLYVSLRTDAGANLRVYSLAGDPRADVTYGGPGDYPMALKKSFAGEPYYLIKEGAELVVRKFDLDTDGDGLLDRWETQGIDIDHDGSPEYELHLLPGISPFRKNIIVEFDIASGVTDPEEYWGEVEEAFNRVWVNNPDGTTGITIVREPTQVFAPAGPLDDEEEVDFDRLLFGSVAERADPNAAAILAAKRMAVRHVIVFQYRRTRLRGDGFESSIYGRTYGAAGFASAFIAIYDDLGASGNSYYDIVPDAVKRNFRAGVLTHELGHALGLGHGGHDNINFKPNYHSVMNGLHMIPNGWPAVPLTLTFANTPGPTLVEDRLYESVGLGMGPFHDGHMVKFFTGPPGGPYVRRTEQETGLTCDFDADGVIEVPAVTADLTKDGDITTLEARVDWQEMDWSLSHSPGWNLRDVAADAAEDEVEPLLAAAGRCDPLAAAGCTCTVEGQTRPCSTDIGACTSGVQICQGGFWGVCEGAVTSMPERCDTLDNDCDGVNNEDFQALGQACNVGLGACVRSGSRVCSSDQHGTTCNATPGTPTTERCNNSVDDDCDGATDEGYSNLGQTCTAGLGVCARTGTLMCAADGVSATCSATPGTPGTETCGNGLDDDCDGATDEGCLPTPISPPNGHLTGSGRVVSVAGQYNPRQVTFRWAATTPGATYEVQADDASSFASPYSWTTSATTYATGDLFTSGAAPFGTRYFWRVRSRVGQGAWGAWSVSRYVDVGRLPDDTNGDGFADVVVGATNAAHTTGVAGEGAAFVYHGRSGALPPNGTPARTIDDHLNQANARFGSSFALADMDGDGFTDVVVGIPGRTVTTPFGTYGNSGAIAIYFGSATGIPTTAPNLHITSPVPETNAAFGAAMAPAGDVDGDGYADVWVAAPDQDVMIYWNGRFLMQPSVGAAYLYRGGPRNAFPTTHADSRIGRAPYSRFGEAMKSVGDVDNDGTTDMAFAARGVSTVFVYRGGSPTVINTLTPSGTVNFGRDLASGDFDGDGGIDLAVTMTSPAGYHVYRKSGSALGTSPWYGDIGGPGAYDAFIAAGDVDRDGDADLALGYSSISPGGRVVLYLGGASPGIPGLWTDSQSYAELGRSLTLADTSGDARHDIFAGAPRAYLTSTAPREGKVLGWSMTSSPATFGGAPTVIYDSPRNQAEGWFGQAMR